MHPDGYAARFNSRVVGALLDYDDEPTHSPEEHHHHHPAAAHPAAHDDAREPSSLLSPPILSV